MDWARLYSSIYVISGSIVDSNHDGMRDNDDVYDRCVRLHTNVNIMIFTQVDS